MKRYQDYGHKDTRMASVETSINKTQRPTIIADMEFALLSMINKSVNVGHKIKKIKYKENGQKFIHYATCFANI